jgi:methylthioxylose transferase
VASIPDVQVVPGSVKRVLSRDATACIAWAGLIALAFSIGTYLVRSDPSIKLFASPLFGHFDLRIGITLVPAIVVAAAIVSLGPRLAEKVGWRSLLLFVCAGSALWAVSVAVTSGLDGVTGPLLDRHDYLGAVSQVGSPGSFLGGFTDRLASYPIHVQGHPPGMVLLLWSLETMGFGGAGWSAALIIATAASSGAAVLIVWRELAGEAGARRAAPFVCLSPLAIWVATSADALFAGVGAWAICCAVIACRRTGRTRDALALSSGLLLGGLLFLSYGAVLVAAIVCVVVVVLGGARIAVITGAGIAVVAGAFLASGFWWADGLRETIARYGAGVASQRPYLFFLLANLAALAVATGPAVAAGLTRIRWDVSMLPVLAALGAVGLATVSGLSKGEVERIWLPFAVWMIPVASLVSRDTRGWLAAQAGWTILVQVIVRTPW